MAKDKKKSCFVIAPIGDPDSDVRQWSNKIFKHIIKPAVEPDYDPIRAQDIDQSGLVTAQIVDQLLGADLTIADLTDGNPNVYYEVAIRHAVKKPIVHLIRSGQTPRFDIQGMRAIHIDNDLEIAKNAIESLKGQVKKLEEDPNSLTTPVSQAINLAEINKSDNPSDQALADIKRQLKDLSSRLPGQSAPVMTDYAFNIALTNASKQCLIENTIKRIVKSKGRCSINSVILDVIRNHPRELQIADYGVIEATIHNLIFQGELITDSKELTEYTIVSPP